MFFNEKFYFFLLEDSSEIERADRAERRKTKLWKIMFAQVREERKNGQRRKRRCLSWLEEWDDEKKEESVDEYELGPRIRYASFSAL